MMGACTSSAPPPPVPSVQIELMDVQVWLDYMPGSQPSGYATYGFKLTNTTDAEIAIHSLTGIIGELPGNAPIRRFQCELLQNGSAYSTFNLLPGLTYDFTVRSTAGYTPFDTRRYPQISAGIEIELGNGELITSTKSPIDVMITQ